MDTTSTADDKATGAGHWTLDVDSELEAAAVAVLQGTDVAEGALLDWFLFFFWFLFCFQLSREPRRIVS